MAHHEPIYGERFETAINSLKLVREAIGAKSAGEETPFKNFSKVHWLRLQVDYEGFKEAWDTLT